MTKRIQDPRIAASILQSGGIVAIPTETVYGLAADSTNKHAVNRIYRIKNRPAGNPLIVHVGTQEGLGQTGIIDHAYIRDLVDSFWPGPLTLVVNRHPDFPDYACAGLPTIAVRMPHHTVALDVIRRVGSPLAAPSANISGRPSCTNWMQVLEDLDGMIDAVLTHDEPLLGLESTVVDCTGTVPQIMRPGFVTVEQLQTVVDRINVSATENARSPGTRYRHYAPKARVVPVDMPQKVSMADKVAYIGLGVESEQPTGYVEVRFCASLHEYAKIFYSFLRECDAAGILEIHCQTATPERLGIALNDRINRAASGSSRESP